MSALRGKADIERPFRRIGSLARSTCYFFIVIIIVIRHKTTAAAHWALLLIVRTLFNDAITVALWTGFHMCLPVATLASLTRQAKEKLQSQFFSHLVRRSVLAPRCAPCGRPLFRVVAAVAVIVSGVVVLIIA
jgi:hypothetical protein